MYRRFDTVFDHKIPTASTPAMHYMLNNTCFAEKRQNKHFLNSTKRSRELIFWFGYKADDPEALRNDYKTVVPGPRAEALPAKNYRFPDGAIFLGAHISRYTEPFLMILGSFESPHSQLSNDPGIIKNGSVYIKIRVP